jgi:hypothetical protein
MRSPPIVTRVRSELQGLIIVELFGAYRVDICHDGVRRDIVKEYGSDDVAGEQALHLFCETSDS